MKMEVNVGSLSQMKVFDLIILFLFLKKKKYSTFQKTKDFLFSQKEQRTKKIPSFPNHALLGLPLCSNILLGTLLALCSPFFSTYRFLYHNHGDNSEWL